MGSHNVVIATWFVLISLLANSVSANAIEDMLEEEDGEDRSLFTSGGSYYVALNSTTLLTYASVVGFGLLSIILIANAFNNREAGEQFSRRDHHHQHAHNQQYYEHDNYGQQYQHPIHRNKRHAIDANVTNQMHLLAQAFNKYRVAETGCQMLVACESSKVHRINNKNQLSKTVFQVLSNVEKADPVIYKEDPYMKDLITAFRVGVSRTQCSSYRKHCRKHKL